MVNKVSKIRIAGIVNDSITDGPGLRLTVFAQGCAHNCKGCHNPETHDPAGGYDRDIADIAQMAADNPLLDGVTFSGGEPFLQAAGFAELAKRVKALVPGLSVITYTGYTWEELVNAEWAQELLAVSDFIVDGRFEEDKKSLALKYAGSTNQRFINVKEMGGNSLWSSN